MRQYTVYSPIRGCVIDTVLGYKAARKRAGSRFWFYQTNRLVIERTFYGVCVVGVKA
jgi:hypothetical protein